MGLSKIKGPYVPNSSKGTFNTPHLWAFKDDKISLTSGLINRVFYENFIRKNENNREVPSIIQLKMDRSETRYSNPLERRAFCWRCENPTYQYSVDFLHEVREKMYEHAFNSYHCYAAQSACEFCGFESEPLLENQFHNEQPRACNLLRRLVYGRRPFYQSTKQTPTTNRLPEGPNCSNALGNSERKRGSNDRSAEEMQQKPNNNVAKLPAAKNSKARISPQAPLAFQTLRRTWSDECWDNLSLSIWQRFEASKQTEETFEIKMKLWRNMYRSIQNIPRLPKFELFLMGSTISGFGMECSDIDMCVVGKDGPIYCDMRTESLENLLHVKHFLERLPSNLGEILLICAKVPILRFKQKTDDIDIEVSFNNYVGIRNTQLLHCYAQLDWRVRPLVVLVKLWAKHHNLNDPKNSSISSYSFALMVINFLQCGVRPSVLPCLHELYPEKFSGPIQPDNLNIFERVEPFPTDNNDSLGSLFINFLKYYTKFDYASYALSVRTGTIIPVKECSWQCDSTREGYTHNFLNIEEPFNLTNTGKSVHNGSIFAQIKAAFAASWRALEDGQDLSNVFEKTTFPTPSLSSTNTSYY